MLLHRPGHPTDLSFGGFRLSPSRALKCVEIEAGEFSKQCSDGGGNRPLCLQCLVFPICYFLIDRNVPVPAFGYLEAQLMKDYIGL